MIATASSPRVSFNSARASRVMTAVSRWSPMRSRICASRPSWRTSSTMPRSWLRPLSATSTPNGCGRAGRAARGARGLLLAEQAIDFGQRHPVVAAAGAHRAHRALVDPLLQRRVADPEPIGGLAHREHRRAHRRAVLPGRVHGSARRGRPPAPVRANIVVSQRHIDANHTILQVPMHRPARAARASPSAAAGAGRCRRPAAAAARRLGGVQPRPT